MNIGISLPALGLNIVGWGLIVSCAAIFIQRRFGRAWLYRAAGLGTVTVTALATIAFHRSFPDSGGRVIGTLFSIGMVVGVPIAAVTFATARRSAIASTGQAMFWLMISYLASLPVAVLLATIPDLYRFFQA